MKLSELKQHLTLLGENSVKIENVPEHFHVTEFGLQIKDSHDCGGFRRVSSNVVMQIWVAADYDHRIKGDKLIEIIDRLEPITHEIIVEYETAGTIGLYGLKLEDDILKLVTTKTDCLAKEKCKTEDNNCDSKGCW